MKRYELDSVSLYKAFVSGGQAIIERREAINRINVFPVADGDTGTNLAMTLTSVINNSAPQLTAGKTMQAMADAALMGARGNSGIIFAQFLAGLSEIISETATVSSDLLARAAAHAEKRAREAILEPVEGTILTVMREWARLLDENRHLLDLNLIFPKTLRGAKLSLDNTPKLLPILKAEGVVDAGAEGFFRFLGGMTKYLLSGGEEESRAIPRTVSELPPIPEPIPERPSAQHAGGYPNFRYCSEFLLRGESMDLGAIRAEIAPLGDSLIVAGSGSMVRVHVHSDEPARVLRRLSRFGTILEQKADDMRREYETAHTRKHSIALVTDSVCDLPQKLIDEHQIHMLPMGIIIGEAQYIDGLTIAAGEIYAAMDGNGPYPSTAQPSPSSFEKLYSFLSGYYESIIAIHVSGKLSGTYGASRKAAEKQAGKRITVIDSRNDSGSQALIVLRAAELIAEERSHEEIVAAIEDFIPKARIFVSVPTLKYMVKGGRVSPLKGALAAFLNLKPIVSLDEMGSSLMIGRTFSRKRAERRILDLALDFIGTGKLRCFGIVHGRNRAEAMEYAAALEEPLGMKPLFIQEISPIIALNAGGNTLALVLMKE
jgi:hypothetical protein